MRRLPLLFLLAGAVALAANPIFTYPIAETQTCTAGVCARAAVPVATTEGLPFYGVTGYRLMVCAASTFTLSGAGTLQAWYCDSITSLCMRNPGLDQSVTVSGQRCQVFPDFKVSGPSGNNDSVVFAASGVTVSGGASITVSIYPSTR